MPTQTETKVVTFSRGNSLSHW